MFDPETVLSFQPRNRERPPSNQTRMEINPVKLFVRQYEDPCFYWLNLGAGFVFLADKMFARRRSWRIRERYLLFCCLNAPLTSLASMFLFCHKTRKPLFYGALLLGVCLMFDPQSIFYSDFWKGLGLINLGLMFFNTVFRR